MSATVDCTSVGGSLAAMRGLVRRAAEPAPAGDSVKAAIGRAARALGLRFERAHAHWYGRARSVPAHEWLAARQRLADLAVQRELAAVDALLGRIEREDLDAVDRAALARVAALARAAAAGGAGARRCPGAPAAGVVRR